MLGGALAAMVQPLGRERPAKRTADALIRADLAFLAVELVLIGLLFADLVHLLGVARRRGRAARQRPVRHGVLGRGRRPRASSCRSSLQGLELGHRIPHTILPAVLVLAGGFALRWVMVNAGQASHVVHAAGL